MANTTRGPSPDPGKRFFRIVTRAFAFLCVAIIGVTLAYFIARDIAVAEPWMMELFRAHPAAGEVILWVVCLLAVVTAIKLLVNVRANNVFERTKAWATRRAQITRRPTLR